MNALDFPLEPLAFDYLSRSFGLFVVNNVWTWVAVLTAAVSVWRFRSSSPRGWFPASLITTPLSPSSPSPSSPPASSISTSTKVEEAVRPSPALAAAPQSSPCVFNREGRTSGKFTVYYDRSEEEEADRNGDVNQEGNVESFEKEWLRDNNWEVTMRMRMGDHMGFYRYQDLTVLDGSVVRLWEGCRQRSGSSAAPLITCGGGDDCMTW